MSSGLARGGQRFYPLRNPTSGAGPLIPAGANPLLETERTDPAMNLVTSGDRERRVFVGDLSRKEFRQRLEAGALEAAIVPTAATEQHNEHLEMIHDSLHATWMAEQAALRLYPRVVVTSPVCVGVSEHWMAHRGTLTVRPEIFCEYVFDICRSMARAGLRNVLILNGHGGNVKPLVRRLDEYRERLGAEVNLRFQSYWDVYDPALVGETMDHERLPGHADEFETSTCSCWRPSAFTPGIWRTRPPGPRAARRGRSCWSPPRPASPASWSA